MASGLSTFLGELRRRKVGRVAAAYGAVALTIAHATDSAGARTASHGAGPPATADADARSIDLPASGSGRTSIVVLPFDNMSPDPADSYFSDGLTEEIITRLSGLESLRVISRSSAMALKGTQKDVRTIGKELDVQYVLEGSVRKSGDDLRITAQLIDAARDEHLWAERYDGTLEDVFEMQEGASQAIVGALDLRINPSEARSLAQETIEDVRAWESYLQARHELWRPSAGGLDRAKQLTENAISIVGESALLWATLGRVYFQQIHSRTGSDSSPPDEARRCLDRALELEPNLPAAHVLQAEIHYKTGDLQSVVRAAKRAISLEPDDSDALFWLAAVCSHVGRTELARAHGEHLIEMDPLGSVNYWCRGWIEYVDGNFDAAVELTHRGCQLDPDNWITNLGHVVHLAGSGRLEEAAAKIDDFVERFGDIFWARSFLAYRAALYGDREEALRQVDDEIVEAMWDDEYGSWQMAGMYAKIGELDESFRWLEHAVEDRGFVNYRFLEEIDPMLENLRSDERFPELMKRTRELWSAFAA